MQKVIAALWGALFVGAITVASAQPLPRESTRESTRESAREFAPNLLNKPLPQWTQAEREWGFRNWESRVSVRAVRKGNVVRALPSGAPIAALNAGTPGAERLDKFMADYKTAGLLVLQDGAIRLERYALGHSADSRWTSFSVAKSLTSVLVGAALKDGFIKSIDDPITNYIKGLNGSGYDGVTVRQLLTMTTGVAWNEDYTDPNADVYKLLRTPPVEGLDATTSYMRAVKPLPKLVRSLRGNPWLYNTGETNLLGILVREATKKPLAVYASEKIWAAYGMEQDANWQLDPTDAEVGGCCLQATTRDFGRIGQFVLEGARIGGKGGGGGEGGKGGTAIVPDGYLESSTQKQADIGAPGRGYGYQWWTRDDGTFDAVGIHGQIIHIDRARKLVIVMNSAWPRATGSDLSAARNVFIDNVKAMLDAEQRAGK
ncbi:MAG: serine hydrolase domain-containing protein [Burkholderiales bacterium]